MCPPRKVLREANLQSIPSYKITHEEVFGEGSQNLRDAVSVYKTGNEPDPTVNIYIGDENMKTVCVEMYLGGLLVCAIRGMPLGLRATPPSCWPGHWLN